MRKAAIFFGIICVLGTFSCDTPEVPVQQQQFEELAFNSLEEKVNFSAGYNQCMQFYDLSQGPQTNSYFNLASISNGYIEGVEKGNQSDSIHHSNILDQSFSGMKPDTSLHSLIDISFSYGYIEALKQLKFLKEINFDVKTNYIKNGYTIAAVGQRPSMTQEEMNSILTSYITDVTSKTYGGFLSENKKREMVTTTMNGLQYEIIEEGIGPNPKLGDSVKIHWTGKHVSGEEFMNSKLNNDGKPFSISLPYPGVTAMNEAILLMNEGSKYRFVAPSILCYGKKGFMDPNNSYYIVKPDEPLVYEIELVSIN